MPASLIRCAFHQYLAIIVREFHASLNILLAVSQVFVLSLLKEWIGYPLGNGRSADPVQHWNG